MSRLGLDKRFARGSKVLLDRLVHTQVHTWHVVDSAKAVHAHASVNHARPSGVCRVLSWSGAT